MKKIKFKIADEKKKKLPLKITNYDICLHWGFFLVSF